MIVERIKYFNFIEFLYDIPQEAKRNKIDTRVYRDAIESVLNQVSINFQLTEVTLFEAFFLHSFASSCVMTNINVTTGYEIHPELAALEKKLMDALLLVNGVEGDNGYSVLEFIPMKNILITCEVGFTGGSITNFLGAFTDQFFNECVNDDGKLVDSLLHKNLTERLQTGFYNQLIRYINRTDIISEYTIHSRFLKPMGEQPITIANVRTATGFMNFINPSNSDLKIGMDSIYKFTSTSNSEYDSVHPMLKSEQTTINFCVHGSFFSLLYFMYYTTYVKLSNVHPLRLMSKGSDVYVRPIVQTNYKNLIISPYVDYNKKRNELIKRQPKTPDEKPAMDILDIYNSLPSNVLLYYILEIPIEEAEMFRVSDSVLGVDASLLSELSVLQDYINKTSSSAYQKFFS